MTIQDGFQKIFDNAFSRCSFSIDSTSNICELNDFDFNLCRTVFIDEMISFFVKEYNTDLLTMYLQFMEKCSNKILEHFNKLSANEEIL